MTKQTHREAVLDALCESQVDEYVCGRDNDDNTVEIRWLHNEREWQVIKYIDGGTEVGYEEGGLERTLGWLETFYPEILEDMYNELGLDEDEE